MNKNHGRHFFGNQRGERPNESHTCPTGWNYNPAILTTVNSM